VRTWGFTDVLPPILSGPEENWRRREGQQRDKAVAASPRSGMTSAEAVWRVAVVLGWKRTGYITLTLGGGCTAPRSFTTMRCGLLFFSRWLLEVTVTPPFPASCDSVAIQLRRRTKSSAHFRTRCSSSDPIHSSRSRARCLLRRFLLRRRAICPLHSASLLPVPACTHTTSKLDLQLISRSTRYTAKRNDSCGLSVRGIKNYLMGTKSRSRGSHTWMPMEGLFCTRSFLRKLTRCTGSLNGWCVCPSIQHMYINACTSGIMGGWVVNTR
jgi:hypothetical protein